MSDLSSRGVQDFPSVASIQISESRGLPVNLAPPSSLQYPTLPTTYVQRCSTNIQDVESWSLDQQCQSVALMCLISTLMVEIQDRKRFEGGNIKPDSDPMDKNFPYLSGLQRQK